MVSCPPAVFCPPASPPRPRGATLLAAGAVLALVLSGCGGGRGSRQTIGVYSARHYNTDKELYRRFTAQTGISVNLLEGKDNALIERLRSEGSHSPADVLVLVDAARLVRAREQGLFQPIRSAALERDVPTNLRDPDGQWFGLTRRVRLVVVNPSLVPPGAVRRYADLAGPALRGQLCLRDSRSVYNQSLVADQLIQRGKAATTAWVKGMVANLRQPLFTSDIPLARAVAKGDCGAALVNSYYVARMVSGANGAEDRELAAKLKVVFPEPAHVNLSGAGVTRHSRKAEAATRLIEFLASPQGGRGYAEANNEYPLRGFGENPILRRFGPFRDDGVSARELGENNKAAVALMAANGWQ
jgi:iron(III) transport system substrate-binding protein